MGPETYTCVGYDLAYEPVLILLLHFVWNHCAISYIALVDN